MADEQLFAANGYLKHGCVPEERKYLNFEAFLKDHRTELDLSPHYEISRAGRPCIPHEEIVMPLVAIAKDEPGSEDGEDRELQESASKRQKIDELNRTDSSDEKSGLRTYEDINVGGFSSLLDPDQKCVVDSEERKAKKVRFEEEEAPIVYAAEGDGDARLTMKDKIEKSGPVNQKYVKKRDCKN